MAENLNQKKIKQIANFIVNNITLAEVSSMVIERATETAKFIVDNNLDPKNFSSPVSRKKLSKKILIERAKIKKEEEESWFQSAINKLGFAKKKEEEKEDPSHVGFTTKKKNK